jgi:hypothetical protein
VQRCGAHHLRPHPRPPHAAARIDLLGILAADRWMPTNDIGVVRCFLRLYFRSPPPLRVGNPILTSENTSTHLDCRSRLRTKLAPVGHVPRRSVWLGHCSTQRLARPPRQPAARRRRPGPPWRPGGRGRRTCTGSRRTPRHPSAWRPGRLRCPGAPSRSALRPQPHVGEPVHPLRLRAQQVQHQPLKLVPLVPLVQSGPTESLENIMDRDRHGRHPAPKPTDPRG